MNVFEVVGAILVFLFLVALFLSPPAGVVWGIVKMSRVRRFRREAARVKGTVVESPISASQAGSAVPNGAGGVTYVGGGVRIASRPIVAYPGPSGERLQGQVRFAASQIYIYNQPVDLLVDPREPRDVRLVAADGASGAKVMIFSSVLFGVVLYGIVAGLIVLVNVL